jgi:hypothetical protein
MEIFVFAAVVFVAMVYLLRRGRVTGSGSDEHVPGSESRLPGDDEANLRAGLWPGPGGPTKGSGGGSIHGGG